MAGERSRVEVATALSEQFGPAVSAALLECVPPFGWHEIATKQDLVHLEDRLSAQFRSEVNRLVLWIVPTIFGGITAMAAVLSIALAVR